MAPKSKKSSKFTGSKNESASFQANLHIQPVQIFFDKIWCGKFVRAPGEAFPTIRTMSCLSDGFSRYTFLGVGSGVNAYS
jgi:hypothetical protein